MTSAKRVSVVSIKMVKEASMIYQNRKVRSPEDSYQLLKDYFSELDRELFVFKR